MGASGTPEATSIQPGGLRYASGPGRWVLLASVLGSAIASIDATVVGIALPAIGRDFGTSLATLQWVVTACTLILAGLLFIPVGWSGSRPAGAARPPRRRRGHPRCCRACSAWSTVSARS